MLFLFVGASVCCMAFAVPEVDPATGGSAIALVTGALLIARSRKK
jgi:hypothetical protein